MKTSTGSLILPVTLVTAIVVMSGAAGESSVVGALTSPVAAAWSASDALPPPRPLRGVALRGRTGLRLLVANRPPFLLDVDTGRVTALTGLGRRGDPTISVLGVGRDAVVIVTPRQPGTDTPTGGIYVVRRASNKAIRLGAALATAPSADGASVWLLSKGDDSQCTLRRIGLDGRQHQGPMPVRCSPRIAAGGAAGLVLQEGNEEVLVDPAGGETLLRAERVLAVVDERALTSTGARNPLVLTDLESGIQTQVPWPSHLAYTAEVVVHPRRALVAVAFADPAYKGTDAQVMDVWLLDPSTPRFQRLPDMPADVALKFTSMSWASDGRLVLLASTAGRDVVAVWKPGKARIAVRPVKLPARNSGSDTFVAWSSSR